MDRTFSDEPIGALWINLDRPDGPASAGVLTCPCCGKKLRINVFRARKHRERQPDYLVRFAGEKEK